MLKTLGRRCYASPAHAQKLFMVLDWTIVLATDRADKAYSTTRENSRNNAYSEYCREPKASNKTVQENN